MVRRNKLALTYHYSENWIAGSYYIVNIVKAFNTLPDEEKPELFILLKGQDGKQLLDQIRYPYIRFLNTNSGDDFFINKFLRKVCSRIFKTDVFLKVKLSKIDHIFEGDSQYSFIKNQYYWVHDFQECRLPAFFTAEEATDRSALPKRISKIKEATLILSSYDALNDFNTFFPGYVCKVKTLRFASSLPDFTFVNFKAQTEKLDIKTPYFICSNQFWQHKNHSLVLEAVKILKQKNLEYQVIFTGKNYDHRNSEYFHNLEIFTKENNLNQWVRFCGFLDRNVQLCLAEHSISYIQPSLFEGWSTTVEDAKYLNKYVLLSDIPVHREQLNYNVSFFDPNNAADLAEKMEMVIISSPLIERRDYAENIKIFGRDLLKAFFGSY